MGFPVKAALVAVICFAAWPAQAADGVLIVSKTTSGGNTVITQTQMERDRVRVEIPGRNGEKQAVIFDGARQVLWMVNYDRKTYSEMTKADIDALSGQMASVSSQMEEALKNLPPAQRAQMEAMMKGRGAGGGPSAKPEYRKTGTDKVGRWACDKYEGYRDGQKVSEVCAVDPAAIGVALTDFQAMNQLGSFFQKLMPQAGDRVFSIGEGYSGVPVRRISFGGGSQTTTELTDVTRQAFAPSTFEVPPGYQKEAMIGRGR